MNLYRTNLFLALSLFAVLSGQLWIRISITEKRYQLEQLRAEIVEADAMYRQLNVELQSLLRPELLKERAHKELGMIALDPTNTRILANEAYVEFNQGVRDVQL